MHRSKLRTLGGSVVVTLPKQMLRSVNLQANDTVEISLVDGHFLIEPQRRPRYRLADLIAQCDFALSSSPEESEWLHSRPIGSEEI